MELTTSRYCWGPCSGIIQTGAINTELLNVRLWPSVQVPMIELCRLGEFPGTASVAGLVWLEGRTAVRTLHFFFLWSVCFCLSTDLKKRTGNYWVIYRGRSFRHIIRWTILIVIFMLLKIFSKLELDGTDKSFSCLMVVFFKRLDNYYLRKSSFKLTYLANLFKIRTLVGVNRL